MYTNTNQSSERILSSKNMESRVKNENCNRSIKMNSDILAFTGLLIVMVGLFCIQQAHGSSLKNLMMSTLKEQGSVAKPEIEQLIKQYIVQHISSCSNTPERKVSLDETIIKR